jgi:uncharacterized FAD-dependent dehydrogenase
VQQVVVLKRSIDARQKAIKVNLKVLYLKGRCIKKRRSGYPIIPMLFKARGNLVGAGPAGLFAALLLIELGLKPIVIER